MTTTHKPGDDIAARYKIEEYIGAGGMQEVYRAADEVLEREVALKVPKNTSAERRFKRSATLSARVNHPNAAKTLDYVEFEKRPYLVEELILGEDLSAVRARLPIMDPYLVGHIVHHLARGVAASHHVGVVHRDLKPSNIMVSSELAFTFVKVTDFGIAKMAEEELAAAAEGGEDSITGSHTMMGALPYMAPEMILTPRATGTPSDVWAIGSIAYELLSGVKPFGQGLLAVPKIVSGEIPPAPTFVEKQQFKSLGEGLYDVIKRCWTKDPAERPSADDLVGECAQLCYPLHERRVGTVARIPYGTWGFIGTEGPDIFFHPDSVYGPPVGVGDAVCFAVFPGQPAGRAHPLVKMG